MRFSIHEMKVEIDFKLSYLIQLNNPSLLPGSCQNLSQSNQKHSIFISKPAIQSGESKSYLSIARRQLKFQTYICMLARVQRRTLAPIRTQVRRDVK